MALNISTKKLQIDKANTTVVIAVSVAAFLTVFSLFASKSLIDKHSYQSRVIKAKQKTVNTLNDDIKASDSLVSSYKDFIQQNPNIIGGTLLGKTNKDGDNAKLVLDALPSEYDFPALTTSLEKILTSGSYSIQNIGGTDDSLAQTQGASPSPSPVQMPFNLDVTSDYSSTQALIKFFEQSIRPFQLQSMDISGSNKSIKLSLKEVTYYQPGKNLDIKTEVIK